MAEQRNVLPVISLCVAGLSLSAAFYQNYSHSRNIEVVQRNVIRAEYLRTCREIIDAYFQIRLRATALNEAETADPLARREVEAQVYKFGALGTFLANFRDEAVRRRYTDLSSLLLTIARGAYRQPRADFDKAYAEADLAFGDMNEDCARTARLAIL